MSSQTSVSTARLKCWELLTCCGESARWFKSPQATTQIKLIPNPTHFNLHLLMLVTHFHIPSDKVITQFRYRKHP
jgi:hypothetical protein